MILISNNLQKHMILGPEVNIRVNMAWVQTVDALDQVLNDNANSVVFLDYPQGRKKYPTPVLTIDDAYAACAKYPQIKYLAVSNIEEVENVLDIQSHLPKTVEFVPKIETLKGINEFKRLVSECGIKSAMLDKEDLYLDVNRDNAAFFECIEHIRVICTELGVSLLELEAVVFIAKD